LEGRRLDIPVMIVISEDVPDECVYQTSLFVPEDSDGCAYCEKPPGVVTVSG